MDKVKIDLDVLGALMLHWIRREIQCTDVVIVNESRTLDGDMQLLEQLTQP